MRSLMRGGGRGAIWLALFVLSFAPEASAQLIAAKDAPVAYGHHHLNVTSIDQHKKFWVSTLGGTSVKIGTSPNEIVMFPNVLIFLRQQAPTGGTKGTTVNHLAFAVANLREAVDKARASGYRIATREEAGAFDVVKDDIAFNKEQGTYSAFVMGPDDVKVQLFEVRTNTAPIALHHVHFAGPAAEMKAWYVKVFGATPGTRGPFEAADLPGVNLSFSPAPAPVVGTRGRVVDHIGFEVKDLEAFCRKLERLGITLERPYTKVPALNIAIAFIADPWGTSIELTEGLDKASLATATSATAQPLNLKAQPLKSARLYVFDCGSLNIPDTSPYQLKKEELATNYMSVPCFLVAHPKGTMMWDVGAVPDGAFTTGGAPATLRYATSVRPLTAQLAEVGYVPADITYLALSHFHWDHVGNANAFASATWLVRKVERDVMFAEPASPRTEPANYSALRNSKTVIVTRGDHDVFGDGTVVIKAAPGHSPGHQVLFVKLAQTGPIVLSGDLYHYPEERTLKRVPTTESNAAQTIASRAAVEAFLKKTGAQLWIQHDFTANAGLKKTPGFYE